MPEPINSTAAVLSGEPIRQFVPADAPVHPKERLKIGLNFWWPFLVLVGVSIMLLLALLACAEISGAKAIDGIYQSLISLEGGHAEMNVEQVRMLSGIANDAREQHLAFRTFWLQAAQLILLNLLLPVATALLGYIFGFERGQSANE